MKLFLSLFFTVAVFVSIACATEAGDDSTTVYNQKIGELSFSDTPHCMWKFDGRIVGPAMQTTDQWGQKMFQPGMLDVTGEVQDSASAAGVSLNSENVMVIYSPNELVQRPPGIQCPDGTPASNDPDWHYGWQAQQDRPPAGLSYFYPACGQAGTWLLMNWLDTQISLNGCLIHPEPIQTSNGLVPTPFLWPFEVALESATTQTMTDPTSGQTYTFVKPFAVWKTAEFENALVTAEVAANPPGTYVDYGMQQASALPGATCPDGSPLPSPVGWNYNWSAQPLPPRAGFSYAAPMCGNPHGWFFCNMHTDRMVNLKGRVIVF